MILPGSIYLTDSIELISITISAQPYRKCIVLDLDETSNDLGNMFQQNVMKGTVLLPPPSAIFLEIDGDHDSFVLDYQMYLKSSDVLDCITTLLFVLYSGINIMLYVPSYSEDSVWLNILLGFFQKEFGIHIGTSATDYYAYDNSQDVYILNLMYLHNCIDVLTYMKEVPTFYNMHPPTIVSKLTIDLYPLSGGENVNMVYTEYVEAFHRNPRAVPAIIFGTV